MLRIEIVKENPPLPEIFSLYEEAGWITDKIKEKETLSQLIKGSFCFAIAIQDGAVVGMGRVISDGVSDGYLLDIYVKEEYRRQDIGKEIASRLTKICQERGLFYLYLIAAPDTGKLYANCGYKILEKSLPMVCKR